MMCLLLVIAVIVNEKNSYDGTVLQVTIMSHVKCCQRGKRKDKEMLRCACWIIIL